MMATAHPDDENNGLLVMLNRGQGYRTTLATATRGNGGQNEIGPEIFEALGVLRTEELAALHRFDGAEQYFTRAVDFGFSFSVEETLEKWGHDEVLGDFVRLIRTIRPDVMAGLSTTGTGGGQHHQASAILAREAFKIAGDATKYPEQIREGLRPWQPKKLYFMTGFGGPRDPNAPTGRNTRCRSTCPVTIALLGKTYTEIGTEARSMHKCQGMAQLLSLPGPMSSTYYLAESAIAGQTAARRDDAVRRCRRAPLPVWRSSPAHRRRRNSSTDWRRSSAAVQRRTDVASIRITTPRSFSRCSRVFARVRALRAQLRGMNGIERRRAGTRSTTGSTRRSASSRRRSSWPTTCASKHWLTMVWWCRDRPCASPRSSRTAVRRTSP